MPDQHHKAKELYLQAREVPQDRRRAWLETACGNDAAIQTEVESLLAADEDMPADYLIPQRPQDATGGAGHGFATSNYRIISSLGAGGMGDVWLAEQVKPVKRRVALKIVRWGLDSAEALARFDAECQALALMVHPGIAQVFDAGMNSDGRPCLAMEYVPGIPITGYCDHHRLGPGDRIDLFRQVCLAVQHAHQNGVIHRDLKPGNILVTEVNGAPHTKIIDFGVAKAVSQPLTDRTLHTELHRVIGTPAYMSPEQAEARPGGVDTRSDIYSLGVILYELLTGQLPADAMRLREASYGEMLRIIREEEPLRIDRRVSALGDGGVADVARARNTEPAALIRALRGDLSWIVAKTLRKDRERRYASVAELLADIDRHLQHRPVEARPDSLGYRAGRFLSRHRLGATSAAVLLVTLVAYAITVTLQARALSLERDRVEAEANKTRQVTTFLIGLFGTADPGYALGESFTARELLDRGAARVGRELAEQPELLAPLLTAVGEIYQRLGLYDEAEMRLRAALAAARESARPQDESEVLQKLGHALVERRDHGEAEPLLHQALAMRRDLLGDGHPLVAETLESLSRLHFERGELHQAEALARQGLELIQGAEPDGSLAASLLHRLGLVLLQRSDYAAAEQALRKALEIRRKIYPEPHPEIATSLANLAYLMHTTGRYDEAERLYRDALASYRTVLGETHPWVGGALAGLASTLRSQAKFVEAEAMQREALALHRKNLGDSHVEVAMAFNDLGRVTQDQGRLDEAEALYREALARYPDDHQWRFATLRNLATIFEARGALAEAEANHRELLAHDIATLGEENDRVALSKSLLAGVLVRLGRAQEAEPLLLQAQSVFAAKLPPDHPRHALALLPLGQLLCQRGDIDGGERLLNQGRELRLEHYGADDQRTAEADLALGTCLVAAGRAAEARPHLVNASRVYKAGQDVRQAEAAAALKVLGDDASQPTYQ